MRVHSLWDRPTTSSDANESLFRAKAKQYRNAGSGFIIFALKTIGETGRLQRVHEVD